MKIQTSPIMNSPLIQFFVFVFMAICYRKLEYLEGSQYCGGGEGEERTGPPPPSYIDRFIGGHEGGTMQNVMSFCFPFGHKGRFCCPIRKQLCKILGSSHYFSLNISVLKLLYLLNMQYAIKKASEVNV